MALSAVQEIVSYVNRDNTSLVTFQQDGTAIDFSTATRFILKLGTTELDTDTDPTLITTTSTIGQLQFDLGDSGVSAQEYMASLIVYDPAHPNGQVLVCSSENKFRVIVRDC